MADDGLSTTGERLPAELEAQIFELWFDRPAGERATAIAALCNAHPTWRDVVEHLVAEIAAGEDVMQRTRTPLQNSPLPDRIGQFTIRELLGTGGFGAVYRAEQHEPYRRTVAVKVLHDSRIDERSRLRFELERQTLARMQHGGIAQIFDAGVTPAGQLYFALEFVDGQPITRWCDHHRADQAARIELFLRACAAVQHAHQRGVVHRDLKPTNVLVMIEDDRPVPKVIDFGVAKLLFDENDDLARTREGALVGTPAYMSPEQATGQPVDTRTDVYSLGVLLFELLTGDLPFAREDLATRNVAEIIRVITAGEPRSLTAALPTPGPELEAIARARASSPAALRRGLAGDLVWIVRRALAKQPDDRYASVTALVQDIQHFQRGEPVTARQPAATYLARRFVVRHRVGVTLTAGLVLVAVATIGLLAWSLEQVHHAEQAAVERGNAAILNGYAAHLAAAQTALELGDPGAAVDHLEQCPAEHRGWEWRHLAAQCDVSQLVVEHAAAGRLAYWLDDHEFVVGTHDGTIEVYSRAGECLRSFTVAAIGATAFDHRSRRLLIAEHRRVIALDLDDGATTELLNYTTRDRSAGVRSIHVNPTGTTAYLSHGNGELTRLDLGAKVQAATVCHTGDFAWDLDCTRDGRRIALATNAGIELRSRDGELLAHFAKDRHEAVRALAICPDQQTVLLAVGQQLEKRRLDTGELLQARDIGTETFALRLAPDGKRFYSVADWWRGMIRVWRIDTLAPVGRLYGHTRGALSLAVSPDGSAIVSTGRDRTTRLWPGTPPTAVTVLPAGYDVRDLAIDAGREAFAVAGRHGRITVWDARTLEPRLSQTSDHMFFGVALTATTVFAGGDALLAIELGTGETRTIEVAGPPIQNLELTADEQLLIGSVPGGGLVRVWRLPELTLVHEVEAPVHQASGHASTVFGSGNEFAFTGADERLHWFDATTGRFGRTEPSMPGDFRPHLAPGWLSLITATGLVMKRTPSASFNAFGSTYQPSAIALADTNERVAIGSAAATLSLCDFAGHELVKLDHAFKPIEALAFAASDERLIGLSRLPGSASYVVVWRTPNVVSRPFDD